MLSEACVVTVPSLSKALATANLGIRRVEVCTSEHAIVAAAERRDISGVIIDIPMAQRLAGMGQLRPLAETAPLLLRFSLDAWTAPRLQELAHLLGDAHLSADGIRDWDNDVTHLVAGGRAACAAAHIVSACSTQSQLGVAFIAAAVLCRRRTTVASLAACAGTPPRTLEWRLRRLVGLQARTVLGWCVALHAAWRLERLNWPLKRAAAEAGFGDADSLSEYVRRHTGWRPTQIRDQLGFESLRNQWVQRLHDSAKSSDRTSA